MTVQVNKPKKTKAAQDVANAKDKAKVKVAKPVMPKQPRIVVPSVVPPIPESVPSSIDSVVANAMEVIVSVEDTNDTPVTVQDVPSTLYTTPQAILDFDIELTDGPYHMQTASLALGRVSDETMVEWYEYSTLPPTMYTQPEGCAVYLNAMLFKSGKPGTNSPMARSFCTYGWRMEEPVLGCLCVFRLNDPNEGIAGFFLRRVGFWVWILTCDNMEVMIKKVPVAHLLMYVGV